MDTPQIIEHLSHGVNFTPFDCKWKPASAQVVVVGTHARGSGAIHLYEMNATSLQPKITAEKKAGIKCCTFEAASFEKRHLATGDYEGQLAIWDLERIDTPTYAVKAHKEIINSIDGCGGLNIGNGAPELATGSRDGCVRVWDIRTTEPVASMEPAAGASARDCWTVAFGNSYDNANRVVVAGYDNGDLKLLDLRTMRMLWEVNIGNGIVNVQFDRKDIPMNKLVVSSLESKFRVYDMRTQHPDEGYAHLVQTAHKSTVWMGRHLPNNRDVFATTGGNGTAKLYQYQYPDQRSIKDEKGIERGVMGTVKELASATISTQPIVGFDWHRDKAGLAAAVCLDQTLKIIIATKVHKL